MLCAGGEPYNISTSDWDSFLVVALCNDTCASANDTVCQDGTSNPALNSCALGTDCTDCGGEAHPHPSTLPYFVLRMLAVHRLAPVTVLCEFLESLDAALVCRMRVTSVWLTIALRIG